MQEWNFNQPEALAAFQSAVQFAPHVAMLHFGMAYAMGVGANRWGPPSACTLRGIHPWEPPVGTPGGNPLREVPMRTLVGTSAGNQTQELGDTKANGGCLSMVASCVLARHWVGANA